jgi:hypothetical protein
MCSDAPDTSGMNAAAQANAEIAKEALDFYKGIYASDIRPAQEKQQALADRLVDDYLDTSATQKQFATDQNAYYKETFQPVERQMVRDAMEYDSDANVKRVSGEAAANVNQQFSNARGQSARLAGRYGLASTAFSGPQGASERAQALGAAGAATGAANAVRDKGIALRAGASNFGRNMPNTASNFYAGSNASNSAAFGTGQTAMNSIGQNAAVVGQGFNTAISGNNSAGSLYGQVAQIEGKDSGVWGALGGVAGQFAGSKAGSSLIASGLSFLSDVNAKTDIKPVSDDEALAAVKATPVSRWSYKGGMGDSARHIGPMAQDVNRTMGESAAPGGTSIDPISMNGINMAATAALARKVERLEQALEGSQA